MLNCLVMAEGHVLLKVHKILKINSVFLYVLEGLALCGQRATEWSVGVDGRSLNFWQLAEGRF